jgi:hypothetical protein
LIELIFRLKFCSRLNHRLFAHFLVNPFEGITVDIVFLTYAHLLCFGHKTLLHIVFKVILGFLWLLIEIIVPVCGLDKLSNFLHLFQVLSLC